MESTTKKEDLAIAETVIANSDPHYCERSIWCSSPSTVMNMIHLCLAILLSLARLADRISFPAYLCHYRLYNLLGVFEV